MITTPPTPTPPQRTTHAKPTHRPHACRPPRPPQILPLVEIAPTVTPCRHALADLRSCSKFSRWSKLLQLLRPARRTILHPTHTPPTPRTHPRRPPRPAQILPLVEIAPTAPTCWNALADLRTGCKFSLWSKLPPMLRPARRTTPTHIKTIKMLVHAKIRRVLERFVALLIDSIDINLSALYRLCLNFIIYSYYIYIIFKIFSHED